MGDISDWDVKSGTIFSSMFYDSNFNIMFEKTSFEGNVSDWNVSSGKYFKNMFNDTSEVNLCDWKNLRYDQNIWEIGNNCMIWCKDKPEDKCVKQYDVQYECSMFEDWACKCLGQS